MIHLDNDKLERVLFEVFKKEFSCSNGAYLVIETVEFDISFDDEGKDNNYLYNVKGRYGVEESWQRQFDIMLSTEWSWDFIAGYFCRQIYLDDEE